MLNKKQFLDHVIRTALEFLEPEIPHTVEAEQILMGTALQESRLTYLVQIRGPALGVFQMEPATHDDIWANVLKYRQALGEKIHFEFASTYRTPVGPVRTAMADRMATDMLYAAVMCRLQYFRWPEALPRKDDLQGQARMWKRRYNTFKGAGTVEEYLDKAVKRDVMTLWT